MMEVKEYTLPAGFDYILSDQNASISENGFRLSVMCNVFTKKEAGEWIKQFGKQNKVEWRVARTFPENGRDNVYKVGYRCQHKSYYKKKEDSKRRSKNVNCGATIKLTIKRFRKKSKCTTEEEKKHPCLIVIDNVHSHSTSSEAFLKFRDVSCETKQKILDLFKAGYYPATAYQLLKNQLMQTYKDDYSRVAADRSILPNVNFFYNLFYTERRKCSSLSAVCPDNFDDLQRELDEWRKKYGGGVATCFDENLTIICIVTPLMLRVHKCIKDSGELVFLDTSNHYSRTNNAPYFTYAFSVYGGLPLGYIITSSQTGDVFRTALTMFCSILDSSAFSGRGVTDGPMNILIDNDIDKMSALRSVWPNGNVLLRSVCVLRAVWKWLIDKDHNISLHNRQRLFLMFQDMLMCKDKETLETSFDALRTSVEGLAHRNFVRYIEITWWEIKEAWCTCYWDGLFSQENRTSNYVEYAIRIQKNIVMQKTKWYNVIRFVHFIVTRFDVYYGQRLIDCAHQKITQRWLKKFLPSYSDIKIDDITKENDGFLVRRSNTTFVVEMDLGFCTCSVGINGLVCKHQSCILMNNLCGRQFHSAFSTKTRTNLFFVATGEQPPTGWLSHLNEKDDNREQNVSSQDDLQNKQILGCSEFPTNDVSKLLYQNFSDGLEDGVSESVQHLPANDVTELTCIGFCDTLENVSKVVEIPANDVSEVELCDTLDNVGEDAELPADNVPGLLLCCDTLDDIGEVAELPGNGVSGPTSTYVEFCETLDSLKTLMSDNSKSSDLAMKHFVHNFKNHTTTANAVKSALIMWGKYRAPKAIKRLASGKQTATHPIQTEIRKFHLHKRQHKVRQNVLSDHDYIK